MSIIVPVYNEGAILRSNIEKLRLLLRNADTSYEIIICDDHSTDGTRREALVLSKEDSRITYLRFDQRIGKGGTIKNAAKVARGKAVMMMDADMPVSHQDLVKVLGKWEKRAKLVVAVRKSRPNTSVVRRAMSIGYNALVRLLFRTDIVDHQCGLKVLTMDFAREVFPKIRCDNFLIDTELIMHARRTKIPMEDVEVDWVENRPWGTSKIIPLRAMLTLAADLAILRISQMMGKKLLTFKEVETGKFMNYKLNKVHKATGLKLDIRKHRLLEALRKIYLTVAFEEEKQSVRGTKSLG